MATKRQQNKAAKDLADARALVAQAETAAREAGLEVETIASVPVHGTDRKKGSQTVYVGCKFPRGVMLQLHEKGEIDVPMMGGGFKKRPIFMPLPDQQVRLKGSVIPFGAIPNYPIIGGYGITEVPRAFWEQWVPQNKAMHDGWLRENVICVLDDLPDATAFAKEHGEVRCGLEPMNPAGDKRAEQSANPNLSDVETDTDRDATKLKEIA